MVAAIRCRTKSERQKAVARGEMVYPHRPKDKGHLRKCIAYDYGLVTVIDEQIGRILGELKAQGIFGETVVIFCSEHEDFAGEHGSVWKNPGFYECIHRVPFIFRYPRAFPRGEVFDRFVESVDPYPTLIDLLGIDNPNTVRAEAGCPP